MILVNRLYTVLSMVLIIIVTIFYLIYINKYYESEYLLYIQSNSNYALQNSVPYKQLDVFNTVTSLNNLNVGRVYLNSYGSYSNSGRFIIVLSQTGTIDFKITTDKNVDVGKYTTQNAIAYYPIYVEFHAPKYTNYLQLQYSTNSQNIVLYKLSIEFY